MGIKGFFNAFLKMHNRQIKHDDKFIYNSYDQDSNNQITKSKYLLLDFNSIIHNTAIELQNNLTKLYLAYLIFKKINKYDQMVINKLSNDDDNKKEDDDDKKKDDDDKR